MNTTLGGFSMCLANISCGVVVNRKQHSILEILTFQFL